ncbi:MAG: type III-B CRISPR-associated protein Cas10/Cmr2, partial [Chroococcales cyanobacterium]
MSHPYWQAKIWGLLHDPALKPLYSNLSSEGRWQQLRCMEGWVSPKDPNTHKNSSLCSNWLKHIALCDLIASASDRNTIGRLPPQYSRIDYSEEGLQVHHLLSGKAQSVQLSQWHSRLLEEKNDEFVQNVERVALDNIRDWEDPKKVFWWLWRCYPQALATALGDATDETGIYLLPAETRLPDASLWSHVTMTSALAGGLAGYTPNAEDYPQKNARFTPSRPQIATFSFTPVQELIKASRKMRDFWAGSWLLHYLSAKVCWAIANKYGPDTLLYPCLYAQPIIDAELLEQYSDFQQWIEKPTSDQLLTAGFPNVLVMILPNNGQDSNTVKDNPVQAAMSYAEQTLKQEWKQLGTKVLDLLQDKRNGWNKINPHTWDNWLKSQWQTYWASLPIGNNDVELHQSPRKLEEYQNWIQQQNLFSRPNPKLFLNSEIEFLQAVFLKTAPSDDTPSDNDTRQAFKAKQPNMNVGSWWASIFDQLRYSLTAVKNARNWELPTAFAPRSTVSGMGSVVHPIYDSKRPDWVTEGQTGDFWKNDVGLFDGIEALNATEVLKRGLHKILDSLFPTVENFNAENPLLYPDLSSGVVGWLRKMESQGNQEAIQYYQKTCEKILDQFDWAKDAANQPWGIPWMTQKNTEWLNPRLLNAGWLIEDYSPPNPNPNEPFTREDQKKEKRQKLTEVREYISQFFPPKNNPTDWYVVAAGDGDGMGEWLKGSKLQSYQMYLPDDLKQKMKQMPEGYRKPLEEFVQERKRMGPATHSALSRALLDFSNQLVPYLTEQRYAGRLIYGGGDDVLAYTNLWEWDSWLWDIRQCFKGEKDPQNEFTTQGDYWRWNDAKLRPKNVASRPLFTMGSHATISFGLAIAHHSIPLAITLENLWEAEEEAKDHFYVNETGELKAKDAVQVRVLYGNGNVLKATAKFEVLNQWQDLVTFAESNPELDSAIFEQAASIWQQHPIPVKAAISPWVTAFCDRREGLKANEVTQAQFQELLTQFIQLLWATNTETKDAK